MNEEDELIKREVLARITRKEFNCSDYTIIAQAKGHQLLWYECYGDYTGTWVMLTRYGDKYYIWKDSYGSCSGCDNLQASSLGSESSFKEIWEFAKNYEPFLAVPVDVALSLVAKGQLSEIFPANEREWHLDGTTNKELYDLFSEKILDDNRK